MNTTRTTLHQPAVARPGTDGGPGLLVMSPEACICVPLPAEGSVVIGRSTRCDVQIDDPLASRRHLRLHLGPTLTIEDLDSANGTRLRQERLPSRVPVPLAPGEAIEVGSTVLLVQMTGGFAESRLWSHGYFEEQLRRECARAEVTHGRFALARLQIGRTVPWSRVVPILVRDVPPPHLFAVYAPGEFELLVDTAVAEEASRLLETVRASLAAIEVSVRVGVAWYPRDGRSADALVARANALLRPGGAEPPSTAPEPLATAMRAADELAARAARSNINVLLLGEMGVGKEVMARAIHRLSDRAHKPLLALNCSALTETLIESELFGHERGAFTGATQAKKGLLEAAEGGTVLLDEIGEMPLSLQAKLLRVIEAREILPVGAVRVRPIDVRFIAATNRDLEADVVRGKFRGDLLFRLNTFTITIPPLRERRSEILPLAQQFLQQAARDAGRSAVPALSPAAALMLREYRWPGNVRELRNVIERAVVLCQEDTIGLAELPVDRMRGTSEVVTTVRTDDSGVAALPLSDKQREDRRRIIEALEVCVWNQSRAAQLLGMPRRTLVAKIVRYGIPRRTRGPLTIDPGDLE